MRAGKGGPVPAHLRGSGYAGAARLGHGKGYVYAHDEPDGVAAQQYLPDDLAGSTDYYRPTDRGFEAPAPGAVDLAQGPAGPRLSAGRGGEPARIDRRPDARLARMTVTLGGIAALIAALAFAVPRGAPRRACSARPGRSSTRPP